ncbi:MAG: helix-turn-helix domain-containing protein [Candidatus Nanopelagicales bacterium]
MSDRLSYSPAEAAAVLGVGRSTVYVLIRAGDLPALKIGGRTLITRAALEELLARAEPAQPVAS